MSEKQVVPLLSSALHRHFAFKLTVMLIFIGIEAPPQDPFPGTTSQEQDAGAAFVLESKGEWWHVGYHLVTAIVGTAVLSLPYAIGGLGWGLGFFCLTFMGVVAFYSFNLMSLVLEHCEKLGRRHIRFRDLAADVLGSGWMFYYVIFIQTTIHTGTAIGSILLAGECLQDIWAYVMDMILKNLSTKEGLSWNARSRNPSDVRIMYLSFTPNGSMKLYEFIAIVTTIMIVLSQIPTFHSLRHMNLGSLVLTCGYTFLVVCACLYAGNRKNAPAKDYSLKASTLSMVLSAFNSISILASFFGNGIIPEIQATLAPPVTGKMFKGLVLCYCVLFISFYSSAVSGYWAFGNTANANIFKSLMPDEGHSLAPSWLLRLAIVFVLLQLFAIGLVYSQVSYEIMETKSADVKQGLFSKRNLIPRIILRTLFMIFCGVFAAMLPFFGDINSVLGAVGFIPLDFIFPMLLYNKTYKPSKSSYTYWINTSIMIVFTSVGLLGSFSTLRQLVLDANQFKIFSNVITN